jgi:hypothetical protein
MNGTIAALLTILAIVLAWAIQNHVDALLIFIFNFFRLLAAIVEGFCRLLGQFYHSAAPTFFAVRHSRLAIYAHTTMFGFIDTVMRLPTQSTGVVFQSYISALGDDQTAPKGIEQAFNNGGQETDQLADIQGSSPQMAVREVPDQHEVQCKKMQCAGQNKKGKRCGLFKKMPDGEEYDCGKHTT